jgi:hypothetical protein
VAAAARHLVSRPRPCPSFQVYHDGLWRSVEEGCG